MRALGATIRFSAPNASARETLCADVQRETGATLIHPFDNADVIAGQGTAALELLEDAPDLDIVIAPIGGGGLLSGTAIAAKGLRPGIRVFGAEPANADDASRGFRSGRVEPVSTTTTIADGLRSPVSARTLGAVRANVEAIGTASEEAIVRAMRMTWEKMKIVIEPSVRASRWRASSSARWTSAARASASSFPAAMSIWIGCPGSLKRRSVSMKTPEIRCPRLSMEARPERALELPAALRHAVVHVRDRRRLSRLRRPLASYAMPDVRRSLAAPRLVRRSRGRHVRLRSGARSTLPSDSSTT